MVTRRVAISQTLLPFPPCGAGAGGWGQNQTMTIETPALLDALNSVIGIPLIPFAGRQIDFAGHALNIDYLMRNNSLSGGTPTRRFNRRDQPGASHRLRRSGQAARYRRSANGRGGVLMAAVAPNPLPAAAELIARLAKLTRPPDVYLIMPLAGTYGPAGLYATLMAFAGGTGWAARRALPLLLSATARP